MAKLLFSTMALSNYTIKEVAEFAAGRGFDGVEIQCREGYHINEEMSLSELKKIKNIFDNEGVKIFSISGYIRFMSFNESERNKNLDNLFKQIEIAEELNASSVRSLGGFVNFNDWNQNPDKYIEMLASYLRIAVEKTEGSNVDILQSTHDNFSPANIATKVIRCVNNPRVSLIWCIIHPFQYGEDLDETWKNIKGNFKMVHFKDSLKGKLYDWWPLKKLGEGELPLRKITNLLLDVNYDGPISIEWEKHAHPEIDDSKIVLTEGIKYLKSIFND